MLTLPKALVILYFLPLWLFGKHVVYFPPIKGITSLIPWKSLFFLSYKFLGDHVYVLAVRHFLSVQLLNEHTPHALILLLGRCRTFESQYVNAFLIWVAQSIFLQLWVKRLRAALSQWVPASYSLEICHSARQDIRDQGYDGRHLKWPLLCCYNLSQSVK